MATITNTHELLVYPVVKFDPIEHTLNDPPQTNVATQTKSARANLIILQVSIINFLTSVTTGFIVVGLPRIALDLDLPEKLFLWPSSV